MDCKTARTLLEFARPTAPDLDAADREALAAHLAVCSDCDALARAERQADEHLSQAVRDVPVPQGLRERLLERLKDERDAWFRKVVARGARWLAAAAAVALVVYGGMLWMASKKDLLDADKVVAEALEKVIAPDGHDEVQGWFKAQGVDTLPPDRFNYAYLASYGLTSFQKERRVPQLHFVRVYGPGQGAQVAVVYILSDRQFNIRELPELTESQSGDNFKAQVWHPKGRGYAYVIVYTGDLDALYRSNSASKGN